MSEWDYILWTTVAVVGLMGSAVYSGMETGSYTLNQVRLHVLAHQGVKSAQHLMRLIENPTLLLAVLLIGNNIANYAGTAGLTVILEAQGFSDAQLFVLNTLILTPMLLVFGEILPKDFFSLNADTWMYRLTWVLRVSRWVFTWTGLLWFIHLVSSTAMRLAGQTGEVGPLHPRRQVGALVKEGVGKGLLSDEQSAMTERVLELSARRVKDEMTAWNSVMTVRDTDAPTRLWDLADETSRSRFPVLDAEDRLLGVVHVLDALRQGSPEQCPPITEVMRPALTIRQDTPLRAALARLQEQRRAIAVVMSHEDRPVGVVTVKDLVEPITGELASW